MPRRLSRAVVPFAVVAALVASDGARAHGRHGTADGYIATFSALKPNVVGVLVNVYGPQNLFRLSNYSGKTVVVLGARREPYLRFTQSAVYENAASPTAYLNTARAVPPSVRADADPRWRKVASGASYTWHEHRIVWSKQDDPDVVRAEPDEPHLIFNWSIPATADAEPFRINGFLGWAPPRADVAEAGGGVDRLLVAGIAAGAALAVAAIVATLWRRARRPA